MAPSGSEMNPVFVDVEGIPVATYVLDPLRSASAEDVVLCHGTPWSAAIWGPVAQQLRQDHRVFLWDMPGYGASIEDPVGVEAPPRVDLASQRRRFAALLEHWALDHPQVIAHDIGGAVTLGAHLLDGVDYSSVFLLDIVTLDPWGSPFFRLVARHQDVFAALPLPLHRALVREYITGAVIAGVEAGWIESLTDPWATEAGRSAFYRQIAQLTPQDTRPVVERLGDVRCPVAIGWGEQDPWIPSAQAAELARLLPRHPEITLFPGAGHLVPLEATTDLASVLLRWLRHV